MKSSSHDGSFDILNWKKTSTGDHFMAVGDGARKIQAQNYITMQKQNI